MQLDDIEAALARQSLGDYCARMDPGYISSLHTRKICQTLEALERGDIQQAAIFVPPRHGKSYHCSERFPAWYMGKNPRNQAIIGSYAAELAVSFSRRARNLLEEPSSPFEVRVAQDSSAANRWDTSVGGRVVAAGVGGSMTGFGAHLLVIDDPVKDREQADSETYRKKAWDWYTEVARTRLMKGGRQLLMMTRWHEDDLAGRILNSAGAGDWFVLTLPLFAVENDALGRSPGELLWPEGELPVPSVARGEISSRAFSALYQQSPEPSEGLMFKREWLANRWSVLPTLTKVILTVDGAWKTGVSNDFSAMALWGTNGVNYYLIHGWHGRKEYPDLKAQLIRFYAECKERCAQLNAALVEDAASGTALVADLKRSSGIPLIAVKPGNESKESRAESNTPVFEAGKVYLPALDSAWLDEWKSQHLRFPVGTHDDYVDTTSMALKRLQSGSRLSYGVVKPVA
jgi:predicted phage terminase large subunit-like protein